MNEKLILIVASALSLLILIIVLKLCSKFRNKVYKLFIKAEKEAEKGEKMDYVVSQLYTVIPYPLNLFVNESVLRWILQKMFEVIEDFLNDGKINNK